MRHVPNLNHGGELPILPGLRGIEIPDLGDRCGHLTEQPARPDRPGDSAPLVLEGYSHLKARQTSSIEATIQASITSALVWMALQPAPL